MKLRLRIRPVLLLVFVSAIAASPFAACMAAAAPSDEAVTAPAASPAARKSLLRSITASFDATAASRYLFQGIDYSDGRSVLQPNMVANLGPFSAVCWANYQVDLGDVNEVDLSLKATRSVGPLSVSPGYTVLRYPNRVGWSPSQEVFADLSVAAPLSPSLSIHEDFEAGDGVYATLALSYPLGSALSVGTNVFYQRHYYGMTGVPSVELKASGAFRYSGMTLTPSLSRFATRNNGDFTDGARVPQGWLIAINIVPAR